MGSSDSGHGPRESPAAESERERPVSTVEAFTEVVDGAADGDLTRRVPVPEDDGDLAALGSSINRLLDGFETTVRQARPLVEDVGADGETVAARAGDAGETAASMHESVAAIAEGTGQQTKNLEAVLETMHDLAASFTEVTEAIDEVSTASRAAADTGTTGQSAAEDAADAMGEIEARTDETVAEVEALREEVETIDEVVDLIADIADQTNRLALNASIEAARAGEAGSGFAVVADEVKSLAEETKAATADIEASVGRVRTQSRAAADNIEEMNGTVAAGAATVDDAIDALDEVAAHVATVHETLSDVSDLADEQAASTEEAVAMVDVVASIGSGTESQVESLREGAASQVTTNEALSAAAGDLVDAADRLAALLTTFRVEA